MRICIHTHSSYKCYPRDALRSAESLQHGEYGTKQHKTQMNLQNLCTPLVFGAVSIIMVLLGLYQILGIMLMTTSGQSRM